MKLTRATAEPDGLDATHVLAWFPPYLITSGTGRWGLQDIAAYDAGVPVPDDDRSLFAARSATSRELAAWAAGQLGSPVVMLQKATATFTSPGRRQRPRVTAGRKEPVWYLRPGKEAVAAEVEAEVLAALQLRPRPGLYVTAARQRRQRRLPAGHGQRWPPRVRPGPRPGRPRRRLAAWLHPLPRPDRSRRLAPRPVRRLHEVGRPVSTPPSEVLSSLPTVQRSRRGQRAARVGAAVITAALTFESAIAAPLLPPAPERGGRHRPPRSRGFTAGGERMAGFLAVTKRLLAGAAAVAVVVTVAACGPGNGAGPSSDPFARCPAGTSRIRDVTRPPGRQWVCAR
jgi:hypothetical protein